MWLPAKCDKIMDNRDAADALADETRNDVARRADVHVNVIVGFLAMLELVKQGIIHVSQQDTFGDIHMETKHVGVPRYN